MYTIDQVRNDLKTIAKKNYDLGVLFDAKSRYEARLKYLSGGKERVDVANTLEDIVRKIDRAIDTLMKLESIYMGKILVLPPLYRSILLDKYINGKPRWKVAEKINYGDDNCAKLLRKATHALVKELNKAAD